MRIIAGTYRSRIIKAVEGEGTRPTLDKVKEAIFSRIGPYFEGGVMLDLFGGSGNMSLEAISRGFEEAYICDQSHRAIRTIRDNCRLLGVETQCHITKCDYKTMLNQCVEQGLSFDLIYLDPPYKKQQIDEIISFIAKHQLLKEDGDIVCESLKEDMFQDAYEDIEKVKDSTYGITRITYYTR